MVNSLHLSWHYFTHKDNKKNQPYKGLANTFIEKSGKLFFYGRILLSGAAHP
jgi:hypothetical protein